MYHLRSVVIAGALAVGLLASDVAQASHVATGTARLRPSATAAPAPAPAHLTFALPEAYRQLTSALSGAPLIGHYRRHVSTWRGSTCAVELTVIGRALARRPVPRGRMLTVARKRVRVRGSGGAGALTWYLGVLHDGWQSLTDGNRLTGVAVLPAGQQHADAGARWVVADMNVIAYPESVPDGRTRRQRQLSCDRERDGAADELAALLRSVTIAEGPVAAPEGVEREPSTELGPLIWSDEFNGTRLDSTKWSHRAPGPRHDGVLTPHAVSVRDGRLTITTYTKGGRHYSGMISTQEDGYGGFEQKYGYFEARMRFDSAPGQWSAFWLQSPTVGRPLGDPASAGVEMDVIEHRVRCVNPPEPSPPETCAPTSDISDRSQHGLIWDGYGPESKATIRLSDPWPGLRNGTWHRWALRWTPSGLTFYYDDAPIWTQTGPISQHGQFIILSSEVGAFLAGEIPAPGYGPRERSRTRMQVDYVRVWALR